jgi:3-deoxy-D-manno-octulosonate 8-phosphate phosphatase KdsC-like HAD superfamily phosphatase
MLIKLFLKLNGEKLKQFHLKSGMRKRCSLPTLIQHRTIIHGQSNMTGEKIKEIQIRKCQIISVFRLYDLIPEKP